MLSKTPLNTTKHVQEEPAMVWTIVHATPGHPVVDVYVEAFGSVQKIIPLSVRYINEFTVEVHFSVPRSGFATVMV
jgi:hypothetical protein